MVEERTAAVIVATPSSARGLLANEHRTNSSSRYRSSGGGKKQIGSKVSAARTPRPSYCNMEGRSVSRRSQRSLRIVSREGEGRERFIGTDRIKLIKYIIQLIMEKIYLFQPKGKERKIDRGRAGGRREQDIN